MWRRRGLLRSHERRKQGEKFRVMVSRSFADLIAFLIYIIGRSMLDVCNVQSFFILAAFLAFFFSYELPV